MSLYGSKVVKLVWSLAEITASQRGKNLCPRENNELKDDARTAKRNRVNENLCGLEIGHSSMSGYRPYMEDAHFAGTIPSADDHVLLAIADGHGGDYAAKHACSHIREALESTDEWMSYIALDVSVRPNSLHLLHSALVKAFISLEEQIAKYCVENCKGDGSGTTFTVVIITPTHVICAHVGDSRCLLGSTTSEHFAAMTKDHLPSDPEEEARIKTAPTPAPTQTPEPALQAATVPAPAPRFPVQQTHHQRHQPSAVSCRPWTSPLPCVTMRTASTPPITSAPSW